MKSVILILFNITTQIKWISETILQSIFYEDYLNKIQFDGFYSIFPFSKAIRANAENQLIIYCCSYLEEFEKEFIPSKHQEYSDRIIQFKRIVKPAISRIKKWKNLRDARNNIIAHNRRLKGNSVFEATKIIKYNIPSTDEEYILLADLFFLISENVKVIFPELIEDIDFSTKLNQYIGFQSEKIDCHSEYLRIKGEIEILINAQSH